jgi:type III restriction enzyme
MSAKDDLAMVPRSEPRVPLRIQFDPNQRFQLDAIRSVVDLFDGWDHGDRRFSLQGDEVVPNVPADESFDRQWLLANLQVVQERNGIDISPGLQTDVAMELAGVGDASWDYQSFTVEMETGTGKTYVYLRTICELRQTYGFRKFVIVVPSVAIYEGVAKTFEITRRHFASHYGNEPVHLIRYDGAQLSRLRDFATSSACEILLITLDSFNKSTNNIYKSSERLPGERRPYQFVQEARPILILDEPQNMESPLARSALATLHPLFALRYSATHREIRNQVFRLTPFDAFRRGLVKRIQVYGVTEREDLNRPTLILNAITSQGGIRARVVTDVEERGVTRQKEVVLRQGNDLYDKTGRAEHKKGYVVDEIHTGDKTIRFENGITVREGEVLGASKPEVFRAQIRETIQTHMYAQEQLQSKGIKVLSLFFIDRVANYTNENGIIRRIFDQEFKKLRASYPYFESMKPEEVREAYFASRKQPKSEDFEAIDIPVDEDKHKKEDREAAKRAFELIMKNKEQLLSFSEKTSFIFAHSALKEGWDNPNVFQICTLNQTTSEMKKRQEIGRGLRLCVNQTGERVSGDEINVLTVIANESYQSYADRLQHEYFEDGQADPNLPKPTDARRKPANRNDTIFVKNSNFREFWRRLAQRIDYEIALDTNALIWPCITALEQATYPAPKVVVQKGDYVAYNYTFTLKSVKPGRARIHLIAENSRGDSNTYDREYAIGDDLGAILREERLRLFKLLEVSTGLREAVVFANKEELEKGLPRSWSSAAGQRIRERATYTPDTRYPVFNLIDRAQRETQLTRATLNTIFRQLSGKTQERIFANPEGFAGVFIATIRSTIADAVSESISFEIRGNSPLDLEELFPKEQKLAQRELIEAGDRSLYDLVQQDSQVESNFVERLKTDGNVEFYFKFPPKFRIGLPKLIGNYNPDWGIVRRSDGRLSLHLVRETKGTEDIAKLRFPHEKRKINCAKKYFDTAQIDYRVITDKTSEWWMGEESVDRQLEIADE